MPVLDSKEVIKAAPILKKKLGVELKPEWIRPGGYESCEDAANHILSKALEQPKQAA